MNSFCKILLYTFLFLAVNLFQTLSLKAQLVPDFKVNDDTTNQLQYNARIGTDQFGNFIIVWTDWRKEGDGVNTNAYCQRFSSNGNFVGNNFKLNENIGTSSSPVIAVRKDGCFLACWKDFGVKVRLYDRQGNPIYSSYYINDTLLNRVVNSINVAFDNSGNFVVTWDEYVIGNIKPNIFFQRLDSLGKKIGPNMMVNDDNLSIKHENPSIAVGNEGSFVITWNDPRNPSISNKDDIYYQMFDRNGVKLGNNQKVNEDFGPDNLQHHPKISNDSLGNFIIVWNDDRLNHNSNEIFGQRFSLNGNKIGQNFRVSLSSVTITKGLSAINEKPNGELIVYWTEFLNPSGVPYFQRFRNDGSFFGNNFPVTNQFLSAEKFSSDIQLFNDRIISVWSDERNGHLDVYCNIRSFLNPDTTVDVISTSSISTKNFTLSQNFPNPFNPITNISFDIPNDNVVRLKVYDILGKEVKVIANEFRQAGSYKVTFDGTNLSSGIYFYKLEAGEFIQVKKMLMVK